MMLGDGGELSRNDPFAEVRYDPWIRDGRDRRVGMPSTGLRNLHTDRLDPLDFV